MYKKDHPLYTTWLGMKSRCGNPNDVSYKFYGGRGIRVCDRWLDFWLFVEDVGNRPSGYTLDRIDNFKGYCPDNVRWATRKEQQRNMRSNVIISVAGQQLIATDAAAILGISSNVVLQRLRKGYDVAEALSNKNLPRGNAIAGGKAAALKQKAKTHCPRGHEYTPDNIEYDRNGGRRCRTCHNNAQRERARVRRAKAKASIATLPPG